MRLNASSYKLLKTDAEREDFLRDYFERNVRSLDIRRKTQQELDPRCTFDAYETTAEIPDQCKAKRVCQLFADRLVSRVVSDRNGGVGILMQGEPGCGKTHLAMAILNAVAKTFPGYYITAMDFFGFMRQKDDGDNTFSRRFKNFCAVSVLVIDEIGRSSVTDFERNVLRDVFEKRFDLGLPTILITNLDGDELTAALDKTFTSRLNKSAYQLLFEWEDYRRKTSIMDADPEALF